MATMGWVRGDGNRMDWTPVVDVAAGEVIDLGTYVGIAEHAIPANTKGSLLLKCLFEALKFSAEAIAVGAPVYFDAGTNTATGTIGLSEARMGNCAKAALAADATVWVSVFQT